ncbi:hypothetical protein ACFX1W_004826 [Malus domestica]
MLKRADPVYDKKIWVRFDCRIYRGNSESVLWRRRGIQLQLIDRDNAVATAQSSDSAIQFPIQATSTTALLTNLSTFSSLLMERPTFTTRDAAP